MCHCCKYLISPIWTTGDTYYIPLYWKKCVSLAINSHFYPAYYQGNSRAIDSRLLDLMYTQFGDVTRSDLRKSGAILDFGCLSFHHSVCYSVYLSSFRFHSISWEQLYRIYPILYVHWHWNIFRHDLDWDFTHHFSDICTRVMALDLRQNFVSAQYLHNKLTDFH